jgi:hypothetical protein
MVWAAAGNPWEYDGEAVNPKSIYARWVQAASPELVLSLLDRIAKLEADKLAGAPTPSSEARDGTT